MGLFLLRIDTTRPSMAWQGIGRPSFEMLAHGEEKKRKQCNDHWCAIYGKFDKTVNG